MFSSLSLAWQSHSLSVITENGNLLNCNSARLIAIAGGKTEIMETEDYSFGMQDDEFRVQPFTTASDCDRKRELCLWLEEALCNVGKHAAGKHAAGTTRIKAIGQLHQNHYILTVQESRLVGNPRPF